MIRKLLYSTLFVVAVSFAGAAHAQKGPCTDPNINAGFHTAFNRLPSGSGASGECNPNLYTGSYNHPMTSANASEIVIGSKICSDPWIGEIYMLNFNFRQLDITPQICNISHYNNGHWQDNKNLLSYIQAYQSNPIKPVMISPDKAPAGMVMIDDHGVVRDDKGNAMTTNNYTLKLGATVVPHPIPGTVYRLVNFKQADTWSQAIVTVAAR